MKKVVVYFPDGQKADFATGEGLEESKVENIYLLNPNAVCVSFASGSETVFGNMPFVYHDITSS